MTLRSILLCLWAARDEIENFYYHIPEKDKSVVTDTCSGL